MRTFFVWCGLIVAALGIVACGGGSGGGYSASAAAPMVLPTMMPAATTLATVSLLGAPGFLAPSGRTSYVLSNDTTASLACTVSSGCTAVWPPIAPPAGVALSTGFTAYVRSDNGATQLAYLGHPLYTYSGDSGSAQSNGNGIVSFGGTWSVTRP